MSMARPAYPHETVEQSLLAHLSASCAGAPLSASAADDEEADDEDKDDELEGEEFEGEDEIEGKGKDEVIEQDAPAEK